MRQSVRRRAQNLKKKEAYKTIVRDIKNLASSGKMSDAQKLLPGLYKALDKAAKTNAIKKNKASRLKSRLTKLVSKKK